MEHRINWKESSTSKTTTLFHFKWQHISTGIDFNNISKLPQFNQFVNHLEGHSSITNKLNLFTNLMKFCEKRNLQVFNYIPFSIVIQYDSPSFLSQFERFTEFFEDLKNEKNEKINDRKYSNLFKMGIQNDKVGYKTNLIIPATHYACKNMWLVKATDLNRGRCIKIGDSIEEIKNIIKKFYDGIFKDFKKSEDDNEYKNVKEVKKKKKKSRSPENIMKTFDYKKYRTSCMILQKYIERPLTYMMRKFDVRIWVLYTHKEEVFAFKEGHLKTSSLNYDINNSDHFVHLTNYSVQKYNKEFSKHEIGNEVSFSDFQKCLENEYKSNISVKNDIFTKIKKLIKLTFHSVREKINFNERKFCFELFGFDFIIDEKFEVNLLEVNTNPGLEESSPLIKLLLPRMVDDMLRLTIDDVFETKFGDECKSSFNVDSNENYYSPFYVDGYTQNENLWDKVTDFSDYYENKY